MDRTTERLVDYVRGFSELELTETVRDVAVSHLFDSIAVAVAGSGTEPARIAAKLAHTVHSDAGATVIGYGMTTTPDLAALANTMMVRTYDYNDGLGFRGGGHPSDMISGVLAAAEIAHSSGAEALLGITLAYELLGGLGYDVILSERGFDQGTFMSVAVALAAGKLWRLDEGQMGNAASLGLVPNVPLAVSRWGALSMMKGCSTAFAVRNGLFAAMLAREGFTSAPEPFEGIYGLWHVTGQFEPYLPVSSNGTRVIQMSHIKALPAEANVQGLLGLIPRIRAWAEVGEIESIDVDVAEELVIHLADEPKYDPKTRETADHSLPYMLAVALIDGQITLESYSPERVADPALRPLMRKIRVHGSKEYSTTRRRQAQNDGVAPLKPARIHIRTHDGREFIEEVLIHKGHPSNPMTRDDLNAKFDTIAKGVLNSDQREAIRDAWWNVADASDIGAPLRTLVGFRTL